MVIGLWQQLEDERDDKETAETVLEKQVTETDELLDRIRDRLDESSKFTGFKLPTGETIEQRVTNLSEYGKLYVSRMYRGPIEELARRLRIRCGKWPMFDIPPKEHNEQVHDVLADFVTAVVDHFKELKLDIKELKLDVKDEERRTRHVAKRFLQASLESNVVIEDLKSDIQEYVELCAAIKEKYQQYFDDGGYWDQLVAIEQRQSSLLDRKNTRLKKQRETIRAQRAHIDRYNDLLTRADAVIRKLRGLDPASE
ncbi:hypothetical protein IQ06DRAFT_347614 [Phaeosphaeriaceae sp. SRC1lsM3a]|nr:hypothetical protein IQ06DRAFT_347614 [Stagonospora sp. SRC1lsM3a]